MFYWVCHSSWLLLCFFPLLCGSYFAGDGLKLASKQRIDDGHGCFPAQVRLFSRQTWHIESLYVQMFYPLESLKVLYRCPSAMRQCQRLMYYTCAIQIRDVGNFSCRCFKSEEIAGPTLAPVTEVCQLLDRWHEAAASMLRSLKQLKCSKRDIYKVVPHS